MINDDFYPTPPEVVDRMIAPIIAREQDEKFRRWKWLAHRTILEPSAGKGDILDHLVEHYHAEKRNIYAVERDYELRLILAGKGYSVVDTDFLEYAERYSFDLVLMNPPFSTGVKHILKAWEVLPQGDIVCILNAETVRNAYSQERQLLTRIIAEHGRFEEIGKPFKEAERPTDVECVIVWLHKPRTLSDIEFDDLDIEYDGEVEDGDFSASPLANVDILDALVNQYECAARLLLDVRKLQAEFKFYTKGILRSDTAVQGLAPRKLTDEIDALKAEFWAYVFSKTGIGKQVPSNYRQKFDQFAHKHARLAFTKNNIMAVLEWFLLNREQILEECIVDVFDQATRYYEGNRDHIEGWKSNKSWKMAHRIIMPYGDYNYRQKDFFDDLDKVLCIFSEYRFNDSNFVSILKAIKEHRDIYGVKFASTFFDIRVYQKGTVHLIIKDRDLLARFNQAAAKGKKWIGAGV